MGFLDAVKGVFDKKQDFLEADPYWDQSTVPVNTYKNKAPFTGKVMSVKRIVGPEVPPGPEPVDAPLAWPHAPCAPRPPRARRVRAARPATRDRRGERAHRLRARRATSS